MNLRTAGKKVFLFIYSFRPGLNKNRKIVQFALLYLNFIIFTAVNIWRNFLNGTFEA